MMRKPKRFEDLEVWRCSRQLFRAVDETTRSGSLAKDFGLRDQMRSSAISIVSNIAEGFERDGDQEFMQFLSVAKGSCGELRAQLYLAMDADHIDQHTFRQLHASAVSVSRQLSGLVSYLHKRKKYGRKYKPAEQPRHQPKATEH